MKADDKARFAAGETDELPPVPYTERGHSIEANTPSDAREHEAGHDADSARS